MTNPLIVEPENENQAAWDSAEGAGLYSSTADVGSAWAAADGAQIIATTVGLGLDALGTLADPFDALATAGLGWLFEHVDFLHEVLDALAGDPTQIAAQARTWHNVGEELHRVAVAYRDGAGAVPGWDGATREAYGGAVADFTDRLHRAGDDAEALAALILQTGAMVGTTRALIRDRIAAFVWWLAKQIVVAGVSAFFTFGGSVAFLAGWAYGEAVALGASLAHDVSELLGAVENAAGTAGQIAGALRVTAAQARVVLRPAHRSVRETADDLDDIPAAEVIELSKQHTGVRASQAGWEAPAPS
ncbi:hypothetical protein [Pseudonocardia broussonetiae]|uniref:PPE family protein n=1 Tax=Pseudonocardia broussonetiae TaxID=2736640 RepID=A0A6M6J9I8_9PSEU|nr:hypothetical protein [Pseudonocardia broussonetiae]QJY44448.1 hypothetical protein HOP40_00145 [Pseudonocardia broussonetiae]